MAEEAWFTVNLALPLTPALYLSVESSGVNTTAAVFSPADKPIKSTLPTPLATVPPNSWVPIVTLTVPLALLAILILATALLG